MTLLGVEQLESDRRRGGTYIDGVPWRFVTHTTEAVPDDVDGARAMAGRHPYPPHLWAWPEADWIGQTVPLDRSAFALLHPRGTPETNKMRALQVEIIGRAADTPGWPDGWWGWLGRRVLRPIIDAGYPVDLDQVARTTGPDGYGTGGAVRMTRAQWARFAGVCSHSNVPDNSHWDIGAGRLDLIAHAARQEDVMNADQERKLDEALGLLRALVPNAPRNVVTQGPDVGRLSAGGKPVAELWRWQLEALFRSRAMDPASLAEQIAGHMPAASGGDLTADLEQALRRVFGSLSEAG